MLGDLGYPLEPEVIPRTIEYYLGRTSHGSTLSKIVHAWVLARRDRKKAWDYFDGALRHVSGFDLNQLGAEYRALRASVIRLWTNHHAKEMDSAILEDMIRFNEMIDQMLAESVAQFSIDIDRAREIFLSVLGDDLRRPLTAVRRDTL